MEIGEKLKILIICSRNSANGARLYYRQAKTILSEIKNAEVIILDSSVRDTYGTEFVNSESRIKIHKIDSSTHGYPTNTGHPYFILLKNILRPLFLRLDKIRILFHQISRIKSINPDIVQCCQTQDVFVGFLLKILLQKKVIYDIREDYFNFYYEYGGKNLKSLLRAVFYSLRELLFLRFFNALFCIDPYVYSKYKSARYGVKRVFLLRDFPNIDIIPQGSQSDYKSTNVLNVVYMGSVNKYRGVIEASNYIEIFNKKFTDRRVNFIFYGLRNPIIDNLIKKGTIYYKGHLPYTELLHSISKCDVGLCLLLPLKKYERNIPTKNFEFMAVGLPILTSNFGTCKFYTEQAEAGICIDPLSYQEFEHAIQLLFDEKLRNKLGTNGYQITHSKWSFKIEAEEYIREIKNS